VTNSRLGELLNVEAGQSVLALGNTLSSSGGLTKGAQLSVSIGSNQSSSSSTSKSSTYAGSTLGGTNINITATSGDIDITGSSLNGTNIALSAALGNINLSAGQNTNSSTSSFSSSGWSLGGTLGVGKQGGSTGFNGSISSSQGTTKSAGTTWDSTVINGSNSVTFDSGGNTTLNGAQIIGNSISGYVGGNLDITSLQNSQYYTSSSSSAGLNLSYSGGIASGSFNSSKSNINSNYQSVVDQSGIFAGNGGFPLFQYRVSPSDRK
jgi:filamentous hemagglutinin